MILTIALLAFGLSFIFALGGVGSAVVLIPVLQSLGIPLNLAKPIGLLTNTISLAGASYANIKNKVLDVKLGLPIIIASMIFAPLGAWSSVLVSHYFVMWIFVIFMLFSALMTIFYRKKSAKKGDIKSSLFSTFTIGIASGFISGLLGVGGGMIITPALIFLGIDAKKVATINAFVVPFSSFMGFLTYVYLGSIDWALLCAAAPSAYLGGILGTKVMHIYLKSSTVKIFLGVLMLGFALKLLYGLLA